MADRPIIFSAPMVRALLDGRKTQTRRLIRDEVPTAPAFDNVVREPRHASPYLDAYRGERSTAANPRGMGPWWCWWTRDDRCGAQFQVGYVPGDRLWVREGFAGSRPGVASVLFRAGHEEDRGRGPRVDMPWRSPIHMPRWASRLTLTVTDVRVQRLQEISEEDVVAEGVRKMSDNGGVFVGREGPGRMVTPWPTAIEAYADIWNSLHGFDAWSANPWVVALTFKVEKANIDAPREAA